MYDDAAIIGNQAAGAPSPAGGGLYLHQTSTVRMRGPNTRINNNSAHSGGGLRLGSGNNRLLIYNGEIYNNKAPVNAALSITGSGNSAAFGTFTPSWDQNGTIGSTASKPGRRDAGEKVGEGSVYAILLRYAVF